MNFNIDNIKIPMIGVIFHHGLYNVPAFDDVKSASNRTIMNGSEWYLKRLCTDSKSYRPTSGWKETQKYHSDSKFSNYFEFSINPDIDFDKWMVIAKSINARYVILTAKHHDGYTLWPSKTNDNKSNFSKEKSDITDVNFGSKIDLIEKFKQSAIKNKLKFGLYYSWSEFDSKGGFKSCTKKYMDNIVKVQIKELIKYEPDYWFFDGDWECKTQYAQSIIDKYVDKIKKHKVQVNDRIGYKDKKSDEKWLGKSTYRVYNDRHIPKKNPGIPWTHINTIGYSWGRNKQQLPEHYKSGQELFELYEKVKMLGGDFLINIGPNSDGTICDEELKSLYEFSEIL